MFKKFLSPDSLKQTELTMKREKVEPFSAAAYGQHNYVKEDGCTIDSGDSHSNDSSTELRNSL